LSVLSIHFGALCQPIKRQLRDAKLRCKPDLAAAWQDDADAVTRLAVRGLLSDAEKQRARRRLIKVIAANVESHR
jgi:hypothetical protein